MTNRHQMAVKLLASVSLLLDDMAAEDSREVTENLDRAFHHVDRAMTYVMRDVAPPAEYDSAPLTQVMHNWISHA